MSARQRKGQILGGWTIGEEIGEGGNATVYRAERGETVGALKILFRRHWKTERLLRFKDEVEGMLRCQDIPGVLPLLEFRTPDAPTWEDPPWLASALAEPADKIAAKGIDFANVVELVRDVAVVLTAMHERDISHRDIKPNNLFRYKSRWVVGDFGLVAFEGKAAETQIGERVGPMYYIAPEMLNDAQKQDGKAADVYSLAKTLWVLGTGQKYPLQGQVTRSISSLTMSSYVNDVRAALLDALLEQATHPTADQRPTMRLFATELDAWLAPNTSRPAQSGALDIRVLGEPLLGIKLQHEAVSQATSEAHRRTQETGHRIREMMRPFAQELVSAFEVGHFVSPSLQIDNTQWGFAVRSGVPSRYEASRTVSMTVSIVLSELLTTGQVTLEGSFLCEVTGASQVVPRDLWRARERFLAGGSSEGLAVEKMIRELRTVFRGCVEQAVALR